MTVDLEERLTESLTRRAELSDSVRGTPHESWQRASNHRRRQRTVRVLTSGLCVVALAASGFAVFALRGHRPVPPIAYETLDPAFRLHPNWLPEGVPRGSLVRSDTSVFGRQEESPATRRWQWARGTASVSLEVRPRPVAGAGAGSPISLNESLMLMNSEQTTSLNWSSTENSFSLRASRAVSQDDLAAFAKTLAVEDVRIAALDVPMSLPLVFEKEEVSRYGGDYFWHLGTSTGIMGRFNVSATRVQTEFEHLNHAGQPWSEGDLIEVRGRPARLVDETARHAVWWHERGWAIYVSSDTAENALRIAQSMQDAPLEQFNRLPSSYGRSAEVPRKPRSERESPVREIVSPSTAGLDVTVRVAETETELACVRVLISAGSRDEELCVQITADLVLWQGIRTVKGKRVLVVVGGPAVDAVRLVDRNAPRTLEQVKLGDTGAISMAATSVETANERQYRWLGVAAMEVNESSVGIELFTNVIEEARDADEIPAEENLQAAGSLTDEQLDASFPEATEPDPGDQLIVSLGQVPLGK
jgi:hypothetical protein